MKSWLSSIGLMILGAYVLIDLAKPGPGQQNTFWLILFAVILWLFVMGVAEGLTVFSFPDRLQFFYLVASSLVAGLLGKLVGDTATAFAGLWLWLGSLSFGYLVSTRTINQRPPS